MTDLGDLHHFLNISVERSSDGLFLSQRQYAVELLQRAGMSECHSTATPVDTRTKLSATDGAPVADPSEYRSIAGALQYLTLTRPDLAYAVQQVCLFMHDPREPHLALLKRILRYVKGTLLQSSPGRRPCPVPHCILGCGLGWLPRLSTLHLRLLRLPRRQSHILVFQETDHRLPL